MATTTKKAPTKTTTPAEAKANTPAPAASEEAARKDLEKAQATLDAAKAKVKEARAKIKTARANRVTRAAAAVQVLRDLKAPAGREDLTKAADEAYVAAGGKSNPREAAQDLKRMLTAAIGFGVVQVEGDTVTPKK